MLFGELAFGRQTGAVNQASGRNFADQHFADLDINWQPAGGLAL